LGLGDSFARRDKRRATYGFSLTIPKVHRMGVVIYLYIGFWHSVLEDLIVTLPYKKKKKQNKTKQNKERIRLYINKTKF